jgi:two-component system cell cycle sensor histidine kinase/response regulator CckA
MECDWLQDCADVIDSYFVNRFPVPLNRFNEFRAFERDDMERILVVDDDDAVRKYVSLALSSAGYKVLEAKSGPEAVSICESETRIIDLMLADVMMPKLGGRQLAQQALALQPSLKVLLMSGYPNVSGFLHVASRSDKEPAEFDFIPKPFTPAQLIQKVREMLAAPVEIEVVP